MAKRDKHYWDKLIAQAKVALIGASDTQLKVQLFDVLQDFFDGSNCWNEAIEFTAIPDTLLYPLRPQGGRIVRLEAVLNQHNLPEAAVMPDLGTIRFLYPFSQVQPMTAIVVKTVTDPFACYPPDIPDWVMPKYGIVLLHGLIGNMMLVPAQSYSNPQMANFHLQKFSDGMVGANVAATKMNTIGAQTWMFPQGFRSSSQRGGISTYNVHPSPR